MIKELDNSDSGIDEEAKKNIKEKIIIKNNIQSFENEKEVNNIKTQDSKNNGPI